jgi:hypothetical protein
MHDDASFGETNHFTLAQEKVIALWEGGKQADGWFSAAAWGVFFDRMRCGW